MKKHHAVKPTAKPAGKTLRVPKDLAPPKKPTPKPAPTPNPAPDAKVKPALAQVSPKHPLYKPYKEWLDGKPLSEVAKAIGMKRGALRRQFRKMVGGKEAFRALRASGAGGQLQLFGGKAHVPQPGVPAVDDSKVKHVHAGVYKREGWKLERVYPDGDVVDVFVTKKGTRYVRAGASERADLIINSDSERMKGMPPLRLKLYEDSRVARAVKKAAKADKKRTEAHAERRAKKRAKRAARRVHRKGGVK